MNIPENLARFGDPRLVGDPRWLELQNQRLEEDKAREEARILAEKKRQEDAQKSALDARQARDAAIASATPDQYNAVLNDPRYADLFRYGGVRRPEDYTDQSLQAMRSGPALPPQLQQLANTPGSIFSSLANLGVTGQRTPEELRQQYDRMMQDPMKVSEIQYRKTMALPWEQAPEKGTRVQEYGGAFYGVPGLSPSSVEKPSGGWRAYQGSVSRAPGAGLVTIGIDPRDPNREAKVRAWIDYHKARGTGLWQKGAWGNEFGREDARIPGFAALKKQYPNAPDDQILDAVIRGMYAQSALPPRSFDFMDIVDPIIEAGLTWASGGNPTLAVMYGAGRGASENGLLGLVTGGLQGYGMGSFAGSVQAAGGPAAYLSNMAGKVGNFLSAPGTFLSTTASHIADTPWWQNALDAASSMPSSYWDQFKAKKADGGYIDGNEEMAAMLSKEQYQPDGYKEGGEVEYDPERITISDLPDYLQNHPVTRRKEKALMEMLSDYGLADSIGYMANRAPEVSDEERILASGLRAPRMPVGAERLARMATMLGVDVDGVQPYVVVDPVRKMAQQYGVTLNRDTPIGHVSITKGYQPEDDMDILAAGLAKELGDRARLEARFNRMEGRHGGDIGGMLTYSKEF